MSNTTRWMDTLNTDLNKMISLMLEPVEDDDSTNQVVYQKGWKSEKVFSEIQKFEFAGKEVLFNYISYSFTQVTNDNSLGDENSVEKEGFVIVYKKDDKIGYIINPIASARKNLRKLLKYNGRNEIEEVRSEFKDDLFVWMISRVFSGDNVIASQGIQYADLELNEIKGFRGNTEDRQTKVSADGESVMSVISTLSFLIESGLLNQLKIDMKYGSHENIKLIIRKNSVEVVSNDYLGDFENDEEKLKISRLYLMVYLEILPIIKREYTSNLADKVWSETKKIQFMKSLARSVSQKIEQRINILQNIE